MDRQPKAYDLSPLAGIDRGGVRRAEAQRLQTAVLTTSEQDASTGRGEPLPYKSFAPSACIEQICLISRG
jgi:hypothetical protein